MKELAIIQKTYDLIRWYVPILARLPREYKFSLGHRMMNGLYDVLDELLTAQYTTNKLDRLRALNIKLTILRYQTRLLFDFKLINERRYEYAIRLFRGIGSDLGRWIKQQHHKGSTHETTRKPVSTDSGI
jgi:hypothetical protein